MNRSATACAVLLLAAAGTAVSGEDPAPAFRKRPLYVVAPDASGLQAGGLGKTVAGMPAVFLCPLCGGLAAIITHGLALEDGEKVAKDGSLVDPAIAISEGLAKDFCPMLACSEVRIVGEKLPRHVNSPGELRGIVPSDAYAMVIRTNAWGFNPLMSKMNRYRVFYHASVVLFDMDTGRRLSRRKLSYSEKFENADDAPTREDLLANDGALLKQKLRTIESHAVDEFAPTWRDRWIEGATDVREFAERYTSAWCGQDPAAVAAFFSQNGSLTINDGEPAVGRAAIEEVARSFMHAFPDMVVQFDGLGRRRDRYVYRWTFTGTNTGPDGSGAAVRISGREQWSIGADGRILTSLGSFDEAEYQRQLRGATPVRN